MSLCMQSPENGGVHETALIRELNVTAQQSSSWEVAVAWLIKKWRQKFQHHIDDCQPLVPVLTLMNPLDTITQYSFALNLFHCHPPFYTQSCHCVLSFFKLRFSRISFISAEQNIRINMRGKIFSHCGFKLYIVKVNACSLMETCPGPALWSFLVPSCEDTYDGSRTLYFNMPFNLFWFTVTSAAMRSRHGRQIGQDGLTLDRKAQRWDMWTCIHAMTEYEFSIPICE